MTERRMIIIEPDGKRTPVTGWRAWLVRAAAVFIVAAVFVMMAVLVVGAAMTVGMLLLVAIPVVLVVGLVATALGRR
jgi:hypothetical protein